MPTSARAPSLPGHLLVVAALAAAATACGSDDPPPLGTDEQEVWVNGDFEADSIGTTPPSGWSIQANLNPGITDTRPSPQTLASLNLQTGGTLMTSVVGGAPESQLDPDIGTSGTLRFPKYGQRAARVNYGSASAKGTGRNVNRLRQTMTIGLGDIDPTDNKVHVRFAVAPVLQNPGHTYHEQPYYYVRLHNLTTGQTVYSDFNASGQPGVPWKNFTDPSGQQAQYTDWQMVDVSPGPGVLSVGDQVELTVLAAGCSQSGHWGRVYVDAVGSGIPGLYAWATGPQSANAGATIAYTVNYKNGGTTTTTGTRLDFVTPPNTTFQAVSLGGACTTPAVGATGTVSCDLGTLANGATGSLQLTVGIPAGTAAGTLITNGNYAIYATGISALVGPKVYTSVTSSVQYADLGVTIGDGVPALAWGQPTTYTIVVTNHGPVAAGSVTVSAPLPAQLTAATWTCTGSGGATCPASGAGGIASSGVSIPVGASITYVQQATAIAGSGSGQVINTVTVSVGGGVSDPDTNNNTALDTNALGTLRLLSVTKTGFTAGGTISSVPAAIACGPACADDGAEFLDGAQVVLTAAPVTGATFTGWGGACSGTATTCTVTMTGAQSVTAAFVGAPTTVTIVGGSDQATAVSTAFATPLSVVVTDAGGRPVPGVAVGLTAPASGAATSPSAGSATTDSSGVASRAVSANAIAGAYVVTTTVVGLVGTPSFTLSNLGPPATIAVHAGSGQTATVATAFADELVAVVRDAAGQPRPGVLVTFSAPGAGPGASLTPATAVTDAAGLARAGATAGTVAGSFAVSASVVGVATPASFALVSTAGAPASIQLAAGSGQASVVTDPFAAPLRVLVLDAHGNPVPAASVTFGAPGAGPSALIAPAVATTSASGEAMASAIAGTVAGTYQVIASIAGGASASFTLTNLAGAPAVLTATGGGGQSAVVGSAFAAPLAVGVVDAHGNPVPGASVTFAAPTTGATATVAATVTTDASGLAATTAVAGSVSGDFLIVAAVEGASPVAFALANLPGAPVTIAVVGGDGQSAAVTTTFAQPLRVVVRDAFGNLVPGAAVTFAAAATRATLAPEAAITGGDGEAETSATAGPLAGAHQVTASLSGGAAVTFTLTNLPGAPATIALLGGGGQETAITTAFAQPLVVEVRDAHDNLIADAVVAWTAPSAGPRAAVPASSATGADGRSSVSATAGTVAGAYTVNATAGAATVAVPLVNRPGAAAHIAALGGGGQITIVASAFPSPLVAIVTDAHGNPVPGATVTTSAPLAGASATLAPVQPATDDDGRIAFAATAGTVAGGYTVAAHLGDASATFALTNAPDAPAAIAVVPGGTPQAATVRAKFAAPLAVTVVDRFGNPTPGITVAFAAPASGATASLDAATATTGADGQTAVRATAGAFAGGYAVMASVAGVATPATFALTNLAGAPATIAVTGGAPQAAVVDHDFADALEVIVLDADDNPVPGAVVSFTAPATGATAILTATAVTSDGDGLAAIGARAGTARGGYVVLATVAGGAAPATFALTNLPGAPAAITAAATSTPQVTEVASPFARPLVAEVRDAFGNPVPGVTVDYAAPASGATATLSAATVITDDDGRCAVTATAGAAAGAYEVPASIASLPEPARFALTNVHGAAHRIVAVDGDDQRATVAAAFPDPLVARVEDAHGNPVTGAVVTFDAPGAGATATLTDAIATSDADGLVSAAAVAGTVSGGYAVTAAAAGATAPAAFALTNLADVPATVVAAVEATPQSAQVLHGFAHALAVTVTDRFGNGVPGATVAYAAPTSPGATLAAPTAVTDGGGHAAVAAVADATTGAYVVTATVSGVAPAAFALTNTAAAPGAIAVAAGGGQRTLATTAFGAPLRFQVVDPHGNPVPAAVVSFAVASSGVAATLAVPSASTDAAGQVAVAVTAGPAVGDVVVVASVAGAAAPATATLAVAPIPTTLRVVAPAARAIDRPLEITLEVDADLGIPAGEVELLVDGHVAAAATLTGGAATVVLTLNRRGEHEVSARYPAQGSHGASASAAVTIELLDDEGTLSGGGTGCAAGGGGTLPLALGLAALALALVPRRARGRRHAPALTAAIAIAAGLAGAAHPAAAEDRGARAIERYDAASADSAWFAADSLSFAGDWDAAMAMTWHHARRPLVSYDADGMRREVIVADAVAFQAGVSLTLRERLRLTGTAPMTVYQRGDGGTYNGMELVGPTYAFGDVRVAGDVRVVGDADGPLRLAAGLALTLPTGSRTNYTSDGTFAAEPRAAVAGRLARVEYAAGLGLRLREATELAGLRFGSELRYAAAAGVRLGAGRVLLGPELFGSTALRRGSASGHPLELGLGAHVRATPSLQLGLGATRGLVNAVGAPEQRIFVAASWKP